MVLFVVNKFS